MAAVGNDRLSELPDDLLRRILRFTPLREAASTTALSRRWRAPLWRSSGGVNLETGHAQRYYDNPRFFTRRDDFASAAVAALDAAEVPVTRLDLRLESDLHDQSGDFMTWYRDTSLDKVVLRFTDLVDVVLSHRGARGVEELRLVAKHRWDYHSSNPDQRGLYTLTLDSLQLETLRVLELTHCKELLYQRETAGALVLPQLSTLRLSSCVQHLSSLQRLMDAAPALSDLHLELVLINATDKEAKQATACRLRCLAATVLVLDNCLWEEESHSQPPYGYSSKKAVDVQSVEIDAPRLRRFRYKGSLRSLSFSKQPPEMEQVDLEFSANSHKEKNKDSDQDVATFWRFARSFTSTKELRLRVNHLDDIAVLSEERRAELLPAFRRLEFLEVQGADLTKGKAAAMAILNLLRCCPVLSALRIILAAEKEDASSKKAVRGTKVPQKEIQTAALAQCHLFQCLQTSLRRVGLQFHLEKSNCLGVKLIKFFAENAMVLNEMHVDGGDENLCEEMNPKVEKWNSKRRKSGATSFVLLPLKR